MTPISKENAARYPKNWKGVRARIVERSRGRCECHGECGVDHDIQHQNFVGDETDCDPRCTEVHKTPALFFKGDVVLTVAHLDHKPENCDDDNLRAMCQRCHNRYDQPHRQANAAKTRAKKKCQEVLPL